MASTISAAIAALSFVIMLGVGYGALVSRLTRIEEKLDSGKEHEAAVSRRFEDHETRLRILESGHWHSAMARHEQKGHTL